MAKFYITTAIHYVNDDPHIGHMYENVVADVIARHRRRMGDDVWFLTGTDEHGQKIERAAAKEGILPIELADRVVAKHHELWRKLDISNDDFIRTTESRHRLGVLELIRRIQERNPDDIYFGEHTGWYCQNEETFVPENQVRDGKDESGHPVELTTERNFFFKLERYTQPLLDHYRNNPGFIYPPTRTNEVVSFVEQGLRDLSISRTSVTWGIPFPGHPGHVIYVWMEALTNYISALGFGSADHARFDHDWPADLQLIGKDIIRFHAVYWPAFLMAAGLPLPKRIVGHGWWLRDNQKISKSLGNVVRPYNIIEEFGADAFRYFLLREMVFGQDQNYSDQAFLGRYNADLANDLGNTLSRAIKMTDTYFGGKTPPITCADNELLRSAEQAVPEYLKAMDDLSFQRALDAAWKLLVAVNGYIVNKEPWKKFKESGADETLSRILWNTLEAQRIVWLMMAPFMPSTTREALTRLGSDPDAIGSDALSWGGLPSGAPVRASEAIFPRIDIEAYVGKLRSEGEPKVEETKPQAQASPAPPATASEASASETPAGASPAHAGAPAETTQAAAPDTAKINIEQFMAIDLRVAGVLAAERVPKSKKLMKMTVSTGDEERTIVAGIAAKYTPEELVGRKIIIVANLQPAKLMGVESNGMVLAASIDGEPSLLSVDAAVPAGTKVK
ncbi:MAG: methionyl-tRNA synthetase [Thermoanaerobaculia bacterium]|jgi:methionyl-tRNA synthetase|nr:methionyl-tRNA synthetase [Thermoanaerobaculia bacterium]